MGPILLLDRGMGVIVLDNITRKGEGLVLDLVHPKNVIGNVVK